MKRNRVVAMLMAGIMAISQPVSIYASEDNINEIQTQTEDDSGGSINEESQEISNALQEPEISNEFEAEQKQEDSTIQQEAQNEEPGIENTEDQIRQTVISLIHKFFVSKIMVSVSFSLQGKSQIKDSVYFSHPDLPL